MKSTVYKRKVDTQDKSLTHILDAAAAAAQRNMKINSDK